MTPSNLLWPCECNEKSQIGRENLSLVEVLPVWVGTVMMPYFIIELNCDLWGGFNGCNQQDAI